MAPSNRKNPVVFGRRRCLSLLILCCAGMGALEVQASVRVAAFGDYGINNVDEQAVSDLVHGWFPDFIITTGDNSYGDTPIDDNVGQYYSSFIGSYTGAYGPGAPGNRFFPSLGNHDWFNGGGLAAYEAYFTLPGTGIPSSNTSGTERYYDFVQGPVHFFAIDSENAEPDGNHSTSLQALWLKAQLAGSTAPWKLVYFHHSPYSSSAHGNSPTLQWPFAQWGASAVLTGHDHVYERIMKDGFPYFITGAGGNALYGFNTPEPGSVVRFNAAHGSMLIEADPDSIVFQFYSVQGGAGGTLIDSFTLHSPTWPLDETTLVTFGSTWKYLDDGSDQGTAWREATFPDGAWAAGAAELGYGDGGEATLIDCGPSAPACNSGNFITTYFRHAFAVADPSRFSDLSVTVLRDDGAVVYLNANEILRSNVPADSISATTFASTPLGGSLETVLVHAIVPTTAVLPGTNVMAVEIHQASQTSSDVSFDLQLDGLSPPTDVGEWPRFVLLQNTPNPFNPRTLIGFSLPATTQATLTLFDVRGREVATLASGTHSRGWHGVVWNAHDMASGVYFYRLQAGGQAATKKLVLLR